MQKKNSKSKKLKKFKKFKKPSFKSPFRSFRRSYREDCVDDFVAPGLFAHTARTFGLIFKNWKFFGALLLVTVIFAVLFIGLMTQDSITGLKSAIEASADNFTANGNLGEFTKAGLLLIATITTGGLKPDLSDSQGLFLTLIFLLLWLATIYFLRHFLAGRKISLRDGIYNAFAPLVSSFVVFLIILLEFIPIVLVALFYDSAIATDFLSNPFYAVVFMIFAFLMIALSAYLVSSSIIALVAVSAPGMYPFPALLSTYNLMFRRRIKFIIRLALLIFIIAVNFMIIMLPVILIDGFLKSCSDAFASWPVVPFFLLVATCFNFIYTSAYIYLYYRRMLDHEQK